MAGTGDYCAAGDADGFSPTQHAIWEAVALDIALPSDGLDKTKPFYLVLHGLSGGSDRVSVRLKNNDKEGGVSFVVAAVVFHTTTVL